MRFNRFNTKEKKRQKEGGREKEGNQKRKKEFRTRIGRC